MELMAHRRYLRLLPFGVFAFAFSIYLLTLSPTVGFIDSGELTAVSYTLGVAHPTGYPLYTLLGRLFTLIPTGEVAWRLNLASSLFASLSAAFICLALVSFGDPLAGVTTAILFAFSPVLWSQATQAEVYSLTVFFCATLLLITLSRRLDGKGILLFSFVFGLSLGNHMTILAVAVPVGLYLLLSRGKLMGSRTVLTSLLLFLLGLSVYVYLPVRAVQNPTLNWGDPSTLVRLLRHVSGKQYRVWMFASSLVVLRAHLWKFLRLLIQQFTPFLAPFLILGIWVTFRKGVRLGVLLLSIFLLDLVYLNYDIPDIDPYFLPAILVAGIWVGSGLSAGVALVRHRVKDRPAVASLRAGVAVLVALAPLAVNYRALDRKRDFAARDYATDVLRSLGKGAVCITNNWDIYSPILYLRYVEGIREDAVFIDKELLRRTWYFDYLRKTYPWLVERSEKEVHSYLELLNDFEEGRLRVPEGIQARFIAMINSFLTGSLAERGVFLTFLDGFDRDAPELGRGYLKIPYGLVYWVGMEAPAKEFDYRSLCGRGRLGSSVPVGDRRRLNLSTYPRMFGERAVYEMKRGEFSKAVWLLKEGLEWDWRPVVFHGNLGMSYLNMGDHKKASEEFTRVLAIDPGNKGARRALAAIEEMLQGR